MKFRPELAEQVMAGEKTVTRRATSLNPRSPWYRNQCSLKVERSYAVCPGRGKHQIGRIVVFDVRFETFDPDAIAEAEAEREGFRADPETGASAADAFRATWIELHGDLEPLDVWRIEFKVDEETPRA